MVRVMDATVLVRRWVVRASVPLQPITLCSDSHSGPIGSIFIRG